MKAILKYDLTYDELQFKHAVNGEKYFHALTDLEEQLRHYMRDGVENAETFYDLFADIMSEHEVTIND